MHDLLDSGHERLRAGRPKSGACTPRQRAQRTFCFALADWRPGFSAPVSGRLTSDPASEFCPAIIEGCNSEFAGVAQSVEQLIRNEKVGCSIHLSGTNKIKDLP